MSKAIDFGLLLLFLESEPERSDWAQASCLAAGDVLHFKQKSFFQPKHSCN
jgi:hypothetical protein